MRCVSRRLCQHTPAWVQASMPWQVPHFRMPARSSTRCNGFRSASRESSALSSAKKATNSGRSLATKLTSGCASRRPHGAARGDGTEKKPLPSTFPLHQIWTMSFRASWPTSPSGTSCTPPCTSISETITWLGSSPAPTTTTASASPRRCKNLAE